MGRYALVLAAAMMASSAGCCSPAAQRNLPVSLEYLNNYLCYARWQCCTRFPYSCPPCPYYRHPYHRSGPLGLFRPAGHGHGCGCHAHGAHHGAATSCSATSCASESIDLDGDTVLDDEAH